jgi:SPP1 gp7 family putative phage head morphogenesis protein
VSSEEALPLIAPQEAIAFFKAKGWAIAFDWRDVWQEENVRAFTVAKAMSRDLLEDIRAAVDRALVEGTTLQTFIKDLAPRLYARGWWGRKWMTDPATGESRVVQLGSPARLRTIYQTNLRTSYMAGRWQRIQRAKRTLPFLRYVSVMDGRERPEHHAWHDTILPVDDPWWDSHFPPCGWNCRCDTQALNERTMARRGWAVNDPPVFPEKDYINRRTGEVTRLERGIDPGWSYNVGKASLDGLTPAPRLNGNESSDQLSFSEADYKRVSGFFAGFGLETLATAQAGMVWRDAAGWPQAISLGLLRGPDGTMVRLSARQVRALAVAGELLRAPDRIELVWMTGQDGRKLLVRRYTSSAGVVDLGRDFWRWSAAPLRRAKPGLLVWSADAADLAAYDPRQLRHPKGSRDGGKFRSTGKAAAQSSMHGNNEFHRTAVLGSVGPKAVQVAAANGIDISNRGVKLEHTASQHIMRRHGNKSADRRKVTPEEVIAAPRLLERASSITPGARPDRGMQTIVARLRADDGADMTIVAGVSGRNLLIKTIYAKLGK